MLFCKMDIMVYSLTGVAGECTVTPSRMLGTECTAVNASHRRSCWVHIARHLSLQGPRHVWGTAHIVTDSQSSDSSGKKEAHSCSNGTKPGCCPGRSPSNSPLVHLELTLLQALLSSGTPRLETKTDRRKPVEKVH